MASFGVTLGCQPLHSTEIHTEMIDQSHYLPTFSPRAILHNTCHMTEGITGRPPSSTQAMPITSTPSFFACMTTSSLKLLIASF